MKSKRAQEILFNTYGNIEVTYKNNPVWIEGVDLESSFVLIKDLNSKKMMDVKSEGLTETGDISYL